MGIILVIALMFVLLIAQVWMFKRLGKYLAKTYPDEWHSLAENSLGTPVSSVSNANLSKSLETGYFSTLQDKQIVQFKRFKKVNVALGLAITAVAVMLAMKY